METRCAGDVRFFKCRQSVQIVNARILHCTVPGSRPLAPGSAVRSNCWFEEGMVGVWSAEQWGSTYCALMRWLRGGGEKPRAPMGKRRRHMKRLWEGITGGIGGGEAADRRGSSYVHCEYEPYRAQNMVL